MILDQYARRFDRFLNILWSVKKALRNYKNEGDPFAFAGQWLLEPTCYNFSMDIRIRYFASLSEIIGQNEEIKPLPEGTTVDALCNTLFAPHPAGASGQSPNLRQPTDPG